MLCVLEYPAAVASVKSTALEVEGFARRHLVVCGTEGTMHIQPLDRPQARVAFSAPHDNYTKGYQDLTFPTYRRYVDDAADMARIIRGEKQPDFSYDHDLTVQRTLLQACHLLPVDN
jgi:predicted dehydrogenase